MSRHSAGRGHYAAGDETPSSEDQLSRSQVRRQRRHLVRRAISLTFLSTLLPGLGLLWTRHRRTGIALLAVTFLSVTALAVYAVAGGAMSGAAHALTADGLKVVLIGIVLGLVLWLVSVVTTARATRARTWPRRHEFTYRAFIAFMCLAVTLPAAEAVRYVAVTEDAFKKVFIENGSNHGTNAFKDKPRINFMLVGSDAGADRTGIRTDSLMVASVDTKTGNTTLINIPRNWQRVPFPESNPLHKLYPDGFYCANGQCIMDAVWAQADVEHPELFPNDQYRGLNTTRDVVSEITGLPIDYSAVINLQGFRDLVDAMGGVDVTVPQGGIAIGGHIVNGVASGITGRIPEGRQHLNGQLALWYARSRVETGDGDRMRRQRCMVNAMLTQSNPISLVQKFPDIMRVAKQNILVDMPQSELPDLADLADRMKRGQMKSVNLAYPIISDSHPDFDKVRELIKQGLERSAAPKSTSSPSTSSSSSSSAATPDPSSVATSPASPATTPDATTTSSSTSEQAVSDTAATC